jgi:kynurenine formamidase
MMHASVPVIEKSQQATGDAPRQDELAGQNLEGLSKDRVYQFAFVGASLKLRGADAAPMRPMALAVH